MASNPKKKGPSKKAERANHRNSRDSGMMPESVRIARGIVADDRGAEHGQYLIKVWNLVRNF
jgi:hypothetical protein